MKDYLNGVIERKKAELKELKERSDASQDLNEVKSIGKAMDTAKNELTAAEVQLRALEQKENAETRGAALNPKATFGQVAKVESRETVENKYASLEYREAFKNYVQRGIAIPAEYRAGGEAGVTVTGDVPVIIPMTILNEFIKDVKKVYGQVFAKVRKLNIKGGVKIPISQLSANFHWIKEGAVSEKQKAGDIKEFVEFSYNEGEIRIAHTFLSQIVALADFEAEIVRIMVEAFVKAMDNGILAGTGSGQLLGITTDPRVTNVVSFTEAEIGDWTAWRKQLFAKIPLAKLGEGEFLFTSATIESNLLTMKDANERPLFREAANMDINAGSFFGRSVTRVEPDVIKDFDTAVAGDVIGIFWNPKDYAINTNYEWSMFRYFDHDTNEYINKALVVVDGKILDPSGCYIIKKEV